MIKRLTIRNFKRFTEQVFDLHDSVVLAGPNNSGKSTLLQAIATWRMGLDHWVAQRGRKSKRTAVSVSRLGFTAVPLREMNLLWQDRKVSSPAGPGPSRLIEIVVEGETEGRPWECGLEFQYGNPELFYVRPLDAAHLEVAALQDFPPKSAMEQSVVLIPSLSGIARDEPRHERGMQDLLIGEGRAGDILRNLLLEVSAKDEWESLTGHIKELFHIDLQKPVYSSAQPYILCEYRPTAGGRPLDLANTGSGTLQVLLVLAFLYARPASVILIDEPDAHQHVFLQGQLHQLIRSVIRERSGQIIIATHSEVVLDATDPERVIGFLENNPRALTDKTERNQLRQALKHISTTDILLAQETGAILYVEGTTDSSILFQWARILEHPSREYLSRPFVHVLGGRNLHEARRHFFAIRAVEPKMRALCLLDGDNRNEPDIDLFGEGLEVTRWQRYEIENYLLIPEAIKRFIGFPLAEQLIDQEFDRQIPPGTDLLGDHVSWVRVKASTEFLEPLQAKVEKSTPKRDLYLLAGVMEPDEIHPEVVDMLDRIYELARG